MYLQLTVRRYNKSSRKQVWLYCGVVVGSQNMYLIPFFEGFLLKIVRWYWSTYNIAQTHFIKYLKKKIFILLLFGLLSIYLPKYFVIWLCKHKLIIFLVPPVSTADRHTLIYSRGIVSATAERWFRIKVEVRRVHFE